MGSRRVVVAGIGKMVNRSWRGWGTVFCMTLILGVQDLYTYCMFLSWMGFEEVASVTSEA